MAGGQVRLAPEHPLCRICRAPMRHADGPQTPSAAGTCSEPGGAASAALHAQCCELCRTQVLPGGAAGAAGFARLLPAGMQPEVLCCEGGASREGACCDQWQPCVENELDAGALVQVHQRICRHPVS